MNNGRVAVIVSTSYRGVFFGYVGGDVAASARAGKCPDGVYLTDARMCLTWSRETRGFTGLAAIGPQPGSRVGPAAPELALSDVTSIAFPSAQAISVWESEPWQ